MRCGPISGNMIYGRFATEKEDLEKVNEIARCVFEEELGLAEADDRESFALSALVCAEGSVPAGAGRLLFDGERFVIAEVAVLPAYRGKGYGDFLVRLLIDRAMMSGARTISLDALSGTEGFFAQTGFTTRGEIFAWGGGRWQPMTLTTGGIRRCEECAALSS